LSSQEYAFVVLALVGTVSAVRVVTARNVVRAALYLVATLASVGAIYLLLGSEFVGWVQILIYVGAIVILFLFGLMLTKAPIGQGLDNQHGASRSWWGWGSSSGCLPDPRGVPWDGAIAEGGGPTRSGALFATSCGRDQCLLPLLALIRAIVLAGDDRT
jgi:hypothetical protein